MSNLKTVEHPTRLIVSDGSFARVHAATNRGEMHTPV